MYVYDKLMYHFHKNGLYDDVWKCGNEIVVDDNFNSDFLNITNDFNTNFCDKSFDKFLNSIINQYKNSDFTFSFFSPQLSRDELIKYLMIAKEIIWETNIFKREVALEEVRESYFETLPSRKHSIWVCDKSGLDFWSRKLKPNDKSFSLSLFEVSLTGSLFKSSELLLPTDECSYSECLDASFDYWNPDLSKISEESVEYLFQGTLKILNRVK